MENQWTKFNIGEAIKEMARESKMSQKALSEAAGYRSVSSVALPISRGNLKMSTFLRLAEAAGFDVIVVKRENVHGYNPIKIETQNEES